MPEPVKPKNRSFRASVGILVAGTICLGLTTTIEPDFMLVGFLTMLLLVALPFAVLFDLLPPTASAGKAQFSLRQLLVVVTCVAVYLSLLREPWTFRLRFAASRSALERLAAQVEQGASPEPQWAGLFYIQKANRNENYGVTVLWTEPDGGSPSGFVHPAPKLPDYFIVTGGGSQRHPGPPIHNDGSTALQNDPDWFYFIQD